MLEEVYQPVHQCPKGLLDGPYPSSCSLTSGLFITTIVKWGGSLVPPGHIFWGRGIFFGKRCFLYTCIPPFKNAHRGALKKCIRQTFKNRGFNPPTHVISRTAGRYFFLGRFYLFRICPFKNGPRFFLKRKICLFLGHVQILVVVKNGGLHCFGGFIRAQLGPKTPKNTKKIKDSRLRNKHTALARP